ncbi:MAG: hypothetical protein ABS35_15545 [Kaistia sp. SCN 65-12]|nr:MAG: hypothetical protein ABS35_15545 [Kaistia sp. SCN 65-12]
MRPGSTADDDRTGPALRVGRAGVSAALFTGRRPPATERFYRLTRLVMAHAEQLRDPFEGCLERDETTFGGARKGKRGWGAAGKVIVSASSSVTAL